MNLCSKKRFVCFIMSAFLFSYTFLQTGFTVQAVTDYAAEEEARKSLPIASNSYEDWPDGPAVGAESAILMEANTGTILYEKNIHEELYPASTTKILTCLIGSEQCQMNEMVTMSHDAVFSIPRDSSNAGLDERAEITVEQCMYAILVGSANEAANALGEHVSGSMEAFAELMNRRAKELGCENSHFVTTNGLHNDNHYTSAYDLALIARKFFDNELLCKMSSTYEYYIPQSPTQPDDDLYLHSKNQLLPGKAHAYEYLVGSKTGYTDVARQTLVSCAQKDGMKLICVVMKEESPHQFTDTIALFDYGFDNFQTLNIKANETNYTVDNNNFFQSDNDIFGVSQPILSISSTDYIVLPVTAVFSDAQSTLSYDQVSEDSIATIEYTYHGIPVGSATVDLATEELDTTFDFESQPQATDDPDAPIAPDNTSDHTSSGSIASQGNEDILFINVQTVIFWVVGIAGILIFVCVVKAVIDNYQFAKRRRKRTRYKKRKRGTSPFDDFDF